jgi:hypothetical protein
LFELLIVINSHRTRDGKILSSEAPSGFGLRQPSAAFLPGNLTPAKAPEDWRTPRRCRDQLAQICLRHVHSVFKIPPYPRWENLFGYNFAISRFLNSVLEIS